MSLFALQNINISTDETRIYHPLLLYLKYVFRHLVSRRLSGLISETTGRILMNFCIVKYVPLSKLKYPIFLVRHCSTSILNFIYISGYFGRENVTDRQTWHL